MLSNRRFNTAKNEAGEKPQVFLNFEMSV